MRLNLRKTRQKRGARPLGIPAEAMVVALFTISLPARSQMLYKQPDSVAASVQGAEDTAKWTKHALHFRKSSGQWIAVFGADLNQDDGNGGFTPVLPEIWKTNNGWEVRAGGASMLQIQSNGNGNNVEYGYAAADGSQHSLTLGFPSLSYKSDTSFQFSLGGLTWVLRLDGVGEQLVGNTEIHVPALITESRPRERGGAAAVRHPGAVRL